jgi:hypothetical protein
VFVAVVARAAFASDPSAEMLAAINAERARLDRPPMTRSASLDVLAQDRAREITAYGALDFDLIPASELIARAQRQGHGGLVVQELTAVDEGSGHEIVENWNVSLGGSEVYRRPEALEIGFGRGVVGDLPLTVIVVGVPVSPDPLKKRWPGVVPREYALADLFRDVNTRRFGMGLPPLERSEDLDFEAQRQADEILADPARRDAGMFAGESRRILYFKGEGKYVITDKPALDEWFLRFRTQIAGKAGARAGVGLASRGQTGRLEAVWVLVTAPVSR